MQLKEAICYPYRKENWIRTIAIPMGLQVSMMAICMVAMFAVMMPMFLAMDPHKAQQFNPIDMQLKMMATMLPVYVVMIVMMFPLYGYHWELIDNWQINGLDAPAPGWSGCWKRYFINGFHAFLSMLILFIPGLFCLFTFGLLSPFVYSSYFVSAKEKRVGSVIRNFPASIQLGTQRYLPVLGMFYLIIVICLFAMIPYWILSFTIVGGLVFISGLLISMMHLMTQAYDIHTDGGHSPQKRSSPVPINSFSASQFSPNISNDEKKQGFN